MPAAQGLSTIPIASFTIVDVTELAQRPSRAPNFENENRALGDLAQALAVSPRSILQNLADAALKLCRAHSAGVGVLEYNGGQPVLRWRALAGTSGPDIGSTLPHAFSPRATVLDRDAIQLLVRHVHSIQTAKPVTEEALLIPFHLNHTPLGTMGVVVHDETRRFDAEDVRLLTSLGAFAAAACRVLASLHKLENDLARREATDAFLASADRNRDRFMAILGHELRSQLAPARNAAALLKCETLDLTTRRYIAGIIDRQVSGMTRLVDDLLDGARRRAGNLEMRRVPVALVDIIERAVDIVSPIVTERNQILAVELPSEPISLDADVMWLSQALQNLIGNASKYTRPGGRIVVNVRRDGAQAVVTVSDTGIGIPPAELEQIFDLYVQLRQDKTQPSAGGLGIGLYLVRLLVEAHGGSIQAASAGQDCGSEFIVRLPCNPYLPRA